jgi:MFS family permease
LSILVVGLWGVIGAVIISHHPRHPVGWITLFALISLGPDRLAYGYASYSLISGAASPPLLNLALVWISWTGEPFALLAFTLLFLLFPTGRPLSRRWGKLAWVAAGAFIVLLILSPLAPNALEDSGLPLASPLAVPDSVWAVLDPLWGLAAMVVYTCVLAAGLSIFLRLRRARGEERQQIKWFVYAAAFYPLYVPLIIYLDISGSTGGVALYLGVGILLFSLVAMAIAIAIAIFKHRLYDIDVIINRTLVYGGLTGTLALVYFGSVTLLQSMLAAVSGQQPAVAIVISTLAIAALFTPLRRRVQDFIDRRFYRRKYNAEEALARFAVAARDEVDIERLAGALVAVVEETVQPQSASLWLRPTAGRKRSAATHSGQRREFQGWKYGL